MKKTLAVLLLTLVIFLTSCSPASPKEGQTLSPEQTKTATEKYSQSFTTTANIKYNDMTVVATIDKTASGETTVSFSQPEMLNTLSFTVKNDDIKVNYLGMTFHIDPNNLDSSMLVSTLVNAFNSVGSGKGISATVKDNAISVVGDTEKAKFEMVFDKENGNAISLDVPSIGLKAEFN